LGLPARHALWRALVKGRKEFDMLKFRTMVKDAERKQVELYQRNQTTGGLFLLKVGKFLGNFSIDELAQLFNVLKGEMSLVGPRPLSVADLDNITPGNRLGGYYELRANALPGMTGLWQISGRREISFKEMVLLDLYYIENQSVMFDLEILFATIPVVLFGKGAY
jgi:lipopolysaccharide/colanic/teichoic acid biosynthesis glycosyltransferase